MTPLNGQYSAVGQRLLERMAAENATLDQLTGFQPSLVDHRDRILTLGGSLPPISYWNNWISIPALDQGRVPKCVASSLCTFKMIMLYDEIGQTPQFDDDEFYSHIAAPGGGADIRTALDWMLHQGIRNKSLPTDVRTIKSYAGVVVTDHDAVKLAIAQSGGLEIGFDVPRSFMHGGGKEFKVQPPTVSGGPVDPIVGGHGICVPGYDANGPWFKNTWGADWPTPGAQGLIQVSWDFWDTYVTEAWMVQD